MRGPSSRIDAAASRYCGTAGCTVPSARYGRPLTGLGYLWPWAWRFGQGQARSDREPCFRVLFWSRPCSSGCTIGRLSRVPYPLRRKARSPADAVRPSGDLHRLLLNDSLLGCSDGVISLFGLQVSSMSSSLPGRDGPGPVEGEAVDLAVGEPGRQRQLVPGGGHLDQRRAVVPERLPQRVFQLPAFPPGRRIARPLIRCRLPAHKLAAHTATSPVSAASAAGRESRGLLMPDVLPDDRAVPVQRVSVNPFSEFPGIPYTRRAPDARRVGTITSATVLAMILLLPGPDTIITPGDLRRAGEDPGPHTGPSPARAPGRAPRHRPGLAFPGATERFPAAP